MKPKYSRTEFKGHTHRFIVQFETSDPEPTNLHIYSDSGEHKLLEEFINEHKSSKVTAFSIIHRATKEQDEAAAKFIESLNF